MQVNNPQSQISFDLKDSQLKSIEQSRQSSNGKLTVKTAVRAGEGAVRAASGANFDCIFFARNAPFAPEHV